MKKFNWDLPADPDPKIGVPTFFSFFNQKIFYFRKLFLYL